MLAASSVSPTVGSVVGEIPQWLAGSGLPDRSGKLCPLAITRGQRDPDALALGGENADQKTDHATQNSPKKNVNF